MEHQEIVQKSVTFAEIQKSDIKQKIDEMMNKMQETSNSNEFQDAESRDMERDEAQAAAEVEILRKEVEELHGRMEKQRQEAKINRQELSKIELVEQGRQTDLDILKSAAFEETEISQYLTEKIKGETQF